MLVLSEMTNKVLQFPDLHSRTNGRAARAAPRTSPEEVAEALSAGMVPPDAHFDQFLDPVARALSGQHWTPLAVVVRAAEWLEERRIRTVVDIGSGAGKFCVAAALAGHCHFTGLEQRAHLVASARELARTFGIESRVHFLHGTLGSARLPSADCYYLYNPFEEHCFEPAERIDNEVEIGVERQARDLAAMDELLARARPGTYVLSYNGFSLRMPASYRTVAIDRELPNVLRLWRKAAARPV